MLKNLDIGDFTARSDENTYHQAFTALLRHLKTVKAAI